MVIRSLSLERAYFDLDSMQGLREPLTEQVALQIFGLAVSLYRARVASREGLLPACICEHSMGIYAALVVAGVVTEGDALEFVYRFGKRMAAMGPGKYALACIVGLTVEPLLSIAKNTGAYIANYNTSRHFLLSGPAAAIDEAMAEAKAGGAFSVQAFSADAPLHTPLMAEVADDLASIVSDYCYKEPMLPLINHHTQRPLQRAEMASFLVQEVAEPVYWEQTYHAMRALGVDRFVELGAGDSLRKYNRWIESEHP
jgi:malonyl CoA-acyl carrier protein transacylase